MNIKFTSLLLLTLTTSCQVYQSNFDCPPCDGVPCTSVTEIQKMIIETPDGGPDIFLGKYNDSSCSSCTPDKPCRKKECPDQSKTIKRIWVEAENSGKSHTEGHYIYFEPSEGECQ